MYINQPEEYYEKVAILICGILEIPIKEAPALLNRPCEREKQKKNMSYKVKNKVRHYTNYVYKHSEKIKIAKDLMYYYLWQNKIKSPVSHDVYQSKYIMNTEKKIHTDDLYKHYYQHFTFEADTVKKHNLVHETIMYFV